MRVVMFYHSLISDWNHGNAHFLRGIVGELQASGHDVQVWEPENSWSVRNLLADHGEESLRQFHTAYPALRSNRYNLNHLDLEQALEGAGVVLVHEWNDPELVKRIGDHHRHGSTPYSLFFHDTHHRSVTNPREMSQYDLDGYDGVLAFGSSIADVYRKEGWGHRVWVWHEAADTRLFRPIRARKDGDLVWIGNWGDGERESELREFLIEPVRALKLQAQVHGVRYPEEAKEALMEAGISYGGWAPNTHVPQIFSRYRLTIHVPRRPYATALRGVPTIRMFEALACGIPLVSAPWSDTEGLFTPGRDFLFAEDGLQMQNTISLLLNDTERAVDLARKGRETVLARHTCAHRVEELFDIVREVEASMSVSVGGLI
jgi:spore maturation protein CgeB